VNADRAEECGRHQPGISRRRAEAATPSWTRYRTFEGTERRRPSVASARRRTAVASWRVRPNCGRPRRGRRRVRASGRRLPFVRMDATAMRSARCALCSRRRQGAPRGSGGSGSRLSIPFLLGA